MDRRKVLLTIGSGLLSISFTSRAQNLAKVSRIGGAIKLAFPDR